MRKLTLLCLLTLFSLSIACSRKTSDETIAQDVEKRVAADPQAQDAQVAVESKEGKVTLKGKAKSPATRQRVEQIAKEEPGVSAIDDQVAVEPEIAAAAKPVSGAPAVERTALPVPPPPPPKPVVVPAGTVLTIRTGQELSSKTSQVGNAFTGSVSTPITLEGKMVIPAGSTITGTVKNTKKAGRFKGAAVLTLALDSITIRGH
jgi:hypothetical protein